MQQFDWFEGLLPNSIPAEHKAALLRLTVLAGAYLCSVWGSIPRLHEEVCMA